MATLDGEAFRKDLLRAIKNLPQHTQQALKHTAQYAAILARTSRLYKSHTYGLQKSITGSLVSPTHSQTKAAAKYAGYVENGTRAHFIFPKRRGGMLRFMWHGKLTFREWVFHPGTKSRPFMAEAAKKATPLFERLCKEAVDSMFA